MEGSRIVSIGSDTILLSPDSGTTWWEQMLPVDGKLNDILHAGTSFLAVGDGGITVRLQP